MNSGWYQSTDMLKSNLPVLFLNGNIPKVLKIISLVIISRAFLTELKNVLQDSMFQNCHK